MDKREKPLQPRLPKEIKMKTKGKEITLRDYQYKGVELAFAKQRGTINAATNGGKSATAYAIIKYVQDLLSYSDSILFLIGNASVAVQTREVFKEALGTEIGFWGSGKKDLQQITIGMPQTIHSALKDPAKDVKVTTRNKKLQYMATKYVPMFDKFVTKKPMIRNFLKTHKPKYSYDRECFDELVQMLSMSEQDVSNALYWYTEKWRKFVKKANKKKFKQHEQALDYLDSVKVVIADEVHQFTAETFKDVLNHLPNARMRIGMTGTLPTDNVKAHIFEGEFGTDKLSVTNDELISRGISTKPYICQVPIESPKNLDKKALGALPVGLPKSQLDLMLYQEVYRQGIVHNNYRNGVIANLANKVYNSNSQGVVLIVVKSIEHGNIIEEEINAVNSDINVKYLQGQDTLDRRGEVLDQVKASKVDVLIATSVIDVGVDLPNLQYLVYASGGKSPIQLLQRIGRMLRLGKHKPYIVVYDFVDRTSKYLYAQSQSREKIYDEQKFEFINRE